MEYSIFTESSRTRSLCDEESHARMNPILQLQQVVGNQSVQRLIRSNHTFNFHNRHNTPYSNSENGQENTSVLTSTHNFVEPILNSFTAHKGNPAHVITPNTIARGKTQQSEEIEVVNVQGQGESKTVTGFGSGTSLRLKGRTTAAFGSKWNVTKGEKKPETGCKCAGKCIHSTGILVAEYTVTTKVTLPRVSDFPGLTPCQKQRVSEAISNVLAPHEQEHVVALNNYKGTTSRPFELTLCEDELDGTLESMFKSEESARQSKVNADSDSLDPFHFDVDLDCQDKKEQSSDDTSPSNDTDIRTPPLNEE
jgi:hypothetical protein